MIDAQQAGINILAREEKATADRTSKEALKQLDVMAKMAIEEERIQLEQQKLLTDAAVKQAEIESKDRQMNLKSLEAAEKIGQQDEKDEAQLTLQLMQQLDKEK